ncbi:GtrA family protein [Gracilibacillus sp. Marseille-QA3620]
MNTINYYIFYLLFKNILEFNYLGAHFISFFISIIGSFFMNTYFTYRTKPTLKKFLQFPLTYLVNIAISTGTIFISVQMLQLPDTIAPLVASIFSIPFTFLASRMVLAKP